jgi:transposase
MESIEATIDYKTEYELQQIEITKLRQENEELKAANNWYQEQLRLSLLKRYGSSSEKSANEGQLSLFNEAEISADETAPEPTLEETITYTRRKSSGKREELYDGLPTVRIIHEIPEDEQICPDCGGALHACGHEVLRRELEVIPVQVRAVEHVQTVYACRECEQNSDADSLPMLKAPVPAPVIPGSGIASPSLLAYVLCNKFVLGLPLYRQEQEFARLGINISRQTMANWAIFTATRWLSAIFNLMLMELIACDILHADETQLQVILEKGRKASQKSYMWVYLTGKYAPNPVVLFEYTETRKGENPLAFLAGWSGFLHTDAYPGYRGLEAQGVVLSECWTHARRKFDEALKSLAKGERASSPANNGLAYCNKLFALEREFDEQGLTPEERAVQRNILSRPVAEAFFVWAQSIGAFPKSKLGKAITYALNQKDRLMNVFLDGRLELSNNRAERAVRPFAVGRKNWMFAYSPEGAKASAIIYSIIETAKANGLVPFLYLKYLFETLPNMPESQFSDCLPWNANVQEVCTACSMNP